MDPRPHTRRWTAFALLAALTLIATACAADSVASPTASHAPSGTAAASTPGEPTDSPSVAPNESAGGDVTSVTILDRSFGPAEINVAVGDVSFTNADSVPHTITEGENGAAAPGARFDVVIGSNETVVITFPEPGDYNITCQFHASMHLVVHAH